MLDGAPFADRLAWSDGRAFEIDGVPFRLFDVVPLDSDPGELALGKNLPEQGGQGLLQWYLGLLAHARGGNILELGVFRGGSLALAALLAEPRQLVGIDVAPEGPEGAALAQLLDERSLHDRVRTFWSTDAADPRRLREIVETSFAGPLDLVIDDASHRYLPTKTSFDVLFPLLAEGGVYGIEDWASDHHLACVIADLGGDLGDTSTEGPLTPARLLRGAVVPGLRDQSSSWYPAFSSALAAGTARPDGPLGASMREVVVHAKDLGVTDAELERVLAEPDVPMTRLVQQLVLLAVTHPEVVTKVEIEHLMVTVHRGPGELGPDFTLDAYARDPHELLAPWPPDRPSGP